MVQTENYILTENVLNLIKKNPDFKGRTFRKWLYTNTIMFEFIINVDGTKSQTSFIVFNAYPCSTSAST